MGILKAFDFSMESDHEADTNEEYTSASVKKADLPSSFTVCSAFSVESWSTEFSNAQMFALLDSTGNYWAFLELYAAEGHTEFWAKAGDVTLTVKTEVKFFPLKWSMVCLALDFNLYLMQVVVDGKLLGEKQGFTKQEIGTVPEHFSLLIGIDNMMDENTGRTTNLNVFSSVLSVDRMEGMTRSGGEDCGEAGDYLSWEEVLILAKLHSQAKIVDLDALEGPCRKQSEVQVFTASFDHHHWSDSFINLTKYI